MIIPDSRERNLDALVADRVMGINPSDFSYCAECFAPECNADGTRCHTVIGRDLTLDRALAICMRENAKGTEYGTFAPRVDNVPSYSTDIAAAWTVLNHMVDTRGAFGVWLAQTHESLPHCQFQVGETLYESEGVSFPHAICMAALAAIAGGTA